MNGRSAVSSMEPMYNPLMKGFKKIDPYEAEQIFALARMKVKEYQGLEPSSLALAPVKEYDKYPDVQPRVIVQWRFPLSEQKVQGLEHLIRDLQGGTVNTQKDLFGHTNSVHYYHERNAAQRKNMPGYLFGVDVDDYQTGLWISRLFETEKEAARAIKSKNWLYSGEGFLELRQKEDISHLDFLEYVIRVSLVLAQLSPISNSAILYDAYRSLILSYVQEQTEDTVAGLGNILDFMRWTIFSGSVNPSVGKYYDIAGQSVVLASVPGLGKTTVAKILAREDSGSLFVPLEASSLLELSAQGERDSKSIFETAKILRSRTRMPVILYCDDIEAVMTDPARHHQDMHATHTSSLLNKLEGVSGNGILLCGSTNNPLIIDPRFLQFGRVGYLLHVPLPDVKARSQTFKIHTSLKPLHADINFEQLAQETAGLTNRDIKEVCNVAAKSAQRRAAQAIRRTGETAFNALRRLGDNDVKEYPITRTDFEQSLVQVKKYIDTKSVQKLDEEIQHFCHNYQRRVGFL